MAANNRSLTKLPNLSFEAVLLKLPLPSLFVCCCVSKSLSDLIKNDSGFARAHFAKSEPQLMIEPIWHARCHLIDFDSDLDFTTAARVVVKPSFNLPMRFFRVTNSCNGLLLLEHVYTDQDFHQCLVYNPVTGEYIMIPETVYPCLNVTCAFFYSTVTNQFQILRVFHHLSPDPDDLADPVVELDSDSDSDPHSVPDLDINSEDSGIDCNSYSDSGSDSDSDSDTVYSVSDAIGELFVTGSDSWESVGNVPFSPLSIYSSCHLSNSTHWLCADENVENIIVFFSFSTRQIGEIVGPTCISKAHANAHENMALLVFDNCLTIFDGLLTKGKIEVWKMGEYGVVESWSRVFVIDTMLFRAHGLYNCFRPVMCRNNGEVVMVSASRFMVVYNMVEKKGRIVNHPPLLLPLNVVVHTPSFISLRNVVRGNNLEVLTVASRFVDEELDEFNYLELTRTFSEEAD